MPCSGPAHFCITSHELAAVPEGKGRSLQTPTERKAALPSSDRDLESTARHRGLAANADG